MQLPPSARIGIFFIALGIVAFVPTYYWVQTRTLIPVNMPVTLGSGHIRTGDFDLNIAGNFSIEIETSYNGDPGCFYPDLPLRTSRLAKIGTQIIRAPGNGGNITDGYYLGDFSAKPGRYSIDIEVLSQTKSLDRCHPRLVIAGGSEEFREVSDTLFFRTIFFVFCEVFGLALIGASIASRQGAKSLETVRLISVAGSEPLGISREAPNTTRRANNTWWNGGSAAGFIGLCNGRLAYGITGLVHKPRQPRRIWLEDARGILNTIALITALTLFACVIPVWLSFGVTNRSSHGLFVSVPRRGVPSSTAADGLTAPLISVDAQGRVYLNFKETTWQELPSGLNVALRPLPRRVVYFDGDVNAIYEDAARAVDVITGAGAQAILLTPDSKTEKK